MINIIYTSRIKLMTCFFWALCALITTNASAHQSSTAYLALQDQPESHLLTAEYRLAIRDLALLVPLDADNNQQVTWGEIKQQQADIVQLLNQHLQWRSAQQPCKVNSLQQPFAIDHLAGTSYLVAYLAIDCAQMPVSALNYTVLAQIDDGHRVIMSMSDASTGQPRTWLAAVGSIPLHQHTSSGWIQTVKTYLQEGIHHILTGYDHVLFLLCLLLPAVYKREHKQWIPVSSASTAIRHTIYIATAFTIAHSVTLCLAALNIVSLPSRWIESLIAFSIALVAFNNLVPLFSSHHIRIAFFFGLIHGFGFANVLSDLPVDTGAKVIALFSYNLGIELGQLGCILVFLPIALMLRHQLFYRRVLFQGGSIVACILALLWMTQRIFSLNWIAG